MAEEYGGWGDWLFCLSMAIALALRIPTLGKHKNKTKITPPSTNPTQAICLFSDKKQEHVWPTVLSFPVISTLALALITAGGLGVLSMNPPAVKLAYWCFSIGYSVLLFRIIWWALKECHDSPQQKAIFVFVAFGIVGLVWYASMGLASSRSPVSLNLRFESFTTAVGNLPDRAKASTWNGDPWDENEYADVRLRIDNTGVKIKDLDLTLKLVGDDDLDRSRYFVIPAIGQTTELHGVEFIPTQLGELTTALKGADGKTYTFPLNTDLGKGWSTLPLSSIRVIVSQLLEGQHLSIIIGTSHIPKSESKVPSHIEVSGTGDALIDGNTRQGIVKKELVVIKSNIPGVTYR